MRCDLLLICINVCLTQRGNSAVGKTDRGDRSQVYFGDVASLIFPVRLYKYISIPYIPLDWAFVIAADGLPFPPKVPQDRKSRLVSSATATLVSKHFYTHVRNLGSLRLPRDRCQPRVSQPDIVG
jgi:hypothetical protein